MRPACLGKLNWFGKMTKKGTFHVHLKDEKLAARNRQKGQLCCGGHSLPPHPTLPYPTALVLFRYLSRAKPRISPGSEYRNGIPALPDSIFVSYFIRSYSYPISFATNRCSLQHFRPSFSQSASSSPPTFSFHPNGRRFLFKCGFGAVVLELLLSVVREFTANNESARPYDKAMDALSSLITKRNRGDKSTKGDGFHFLFDYLKILDLEDALADMQIVHVAGTKGKVIADISEEKFLTYFWWCFNRLKVDVAILEVGLGGRFDATNVVGLTRQMCWSQILNVNDLMFQIQKPVVCGIASLGYDHMEILGNTLGEIAGEKAGILKHGVPAFTVQQPEEAMCVLEEKASSLNVDLQVVLPLDANLLNGLKLGLEGEHQYVNAGLAISLSFNWLKRTGHLELANQEHTGSLPEQFIKGLTTASFQGRAQIVCDQYVDNENDGDLIFYLDGAHSPESMDICARWFSGAVKGGKEHDTITPQVSSSTHQLKKNIMQILLFNCMTVRDPQLLLPPLLKTCASQGVYFKKALFVPNMSVYHKVGSHGLPSSDAKVDLSWQSGLQRVWENAVKSRNGRERNGSEYIKDDDSGASGGSCEKSAVFSSLPLAIKWLRDSVKQNQSVRLQVLVTGSLHLIGDVLKLIRK
ncbi:Folylpolyglutamate synthase [Linum grandiflorum]